MHKNDGPEKGERIKKKKLIDTYNGMVIHRGKGGWEESEEGTGRINSDGRRLDFGGLTHNTIYR